MGLSLTLGIAIAALAPSAGFGSADPPPPQEAARVPLQLEKLADVLAARDAELGDFVATYRYRLLVDLAQSDSGNPDLDLRTGSLEVRRRGDRVAVRESLKVRHQSGTTPSYYEHTSWDFYRAGKLHAALNGLDGRLSYRPKQPWTTIDLLPPLATDLGYTIEPGTWRLQGPAEAAAAMRARPGMTNRPDADSASAEIVEHHPPENSPSPAKAYGIFGRARYDFDLNTGASAGFVSSFARTVSSGAVHEMPHERLEIRARRDGWASDFKLTMYNSWGMILRTVDEKGVGALDDLMANGASKAPINQSFEYELVSIGPLAPHVHVDERAAESGVMSVVDDEAGGNPDQKARDVRVLVPGRGYNKVLRFDADADAWVPVP